MQKLRIFPPHLALPPHVAEFFKHTFYSFRFVTDEVGIAAQVVSVPAQRCDQKEKKKKGKGKQLDADKENTQLYLKVKASADPHTECMCVCVYVHLGSFALRVPVSSQPLPPPNCKSGPLQTGSSSPIQKEGPPPQPPT